MLELVWCEQVTRRCGHRSPAGVGDETYELR